MSKEAVDELLGIMEGHVADRKIDALVSIKQSIKRESIEVPAVKPLFQSLRLGLSNSNTQVSSQTLTACHGALRRLNLQDPALLKTALPTIVTQLIDRTGDANDKVADLAIDCLAVAWKASSIEVEGAMKQLGFPHKLARVREHSIRWLSKMAADSAIKFGFRSFTSFLITALEDADPSVRESSKTVLIELYLTVPQHTRADLRREMSMQNVRKSTIQFILAKLEIADGPDLTKSLDEPTRTNKRLVTPTSHPEGSVTGSMASTYIGSLPGSEMESLDAAFVHSTRDLERELGDMLPSFEGRESEKNWMAREKNINRLRALLRGNSIKEHHNTLLTGLKALLEGIVKGMTSLRTSLCLVGLQLVKDMCISLGPAMDSFVEQLLGTLIKLCGATKKIQAQAANITTTVLIAHVSYHSRLMQHLSQAVQDKNVTPRLYAANWFKVLLDAHSEAKSHIEHSGLEVLDKSIRKGLADANPGVRETMRTTYWKYAQIWPTKANDIMGSLDTVAKRQLEKSNPLSASQGPSDRTLAHNRTGSTTRPPIKTLVQMERQKAAQPSIDSITMGKPKEAEAAAARAPALAAAPQRQGLGGAVRPTPATVRKPVVAKSEDTLRSSVRAVSTNASTLSSSSPHRSEPVFSPKRRKPITEQLESDNWKVRVEGVITLACLLANKEPPNSDGQKLTLPGSEILAPILRKLMADSQAEVVDHLMAPEVITEIAKIIEWECILPRVLLVAETDESEHGHDVKSNCLPVVKAMFDGPSAVQQCLDILALLKVSGHIVKPIKANFRFTPAQKRPIIKAVLVWLLELIEKHQEDLNNSSSGNTAFSDSNEYKIIMNRTMSMMTNIQPTSMNYLPLASFLKALRKSDETTFDKNLSTFERPVILALKKAWGEKAGDEDETIHEPVADVQSVLGSLPILPAGEQSVGTKIDSSPALSASLPTTPQHDTTTIPIYNSPDANDDLTMAPSAFAPKTPAGFRAAIPMIESPWTNAAPLSTTRKTVITNGKENLNTETPTRTVGQNVWFRKHMREQMTTTPLPKALTEKIELLEATLQALMQKTINAQDFRRLLKIVKECPTSEDEQNTNDIWDAGSRFDSLLLSTLTYLSDPTISATTKLQALLLTRLMLTYQPHYFAGHHKDVLLCFLELRSRTDSRALVTGIDELSPDLVAMMEANAGVEAILQYLVPYIVNDAAAWKADRLPSLQLAINSLALLIARLSVETLSGYAQALAQVVVKALNDEFSAPDVEVAELRRGTVNLCMAMHTVIGDTRTVLTLLKDLKSSHQNLLTYYFAKEHEDLQRSIDE